MESLAYRDSEAPKDVPQPLFQLNWGQAGLWFQLTGKEIVTDDYMTLCGLHKIGRLHDLISKDVKGDTLHNGHWHNIPTQFCSGGRFLEDIPETTIQRLSAGKTWNTLV